MGESRAEWAVPGRTAGAHFGSYFKARTVSVSVICNWGILVFMCQCVLTVGDVIFLSG